MPGYAKPVNGMAIETYRQRHAVFILINHERNYQHAHDTTRYDFDGSTKRIHAELLKYTKKLDALIDGN